MSENPYAGKPLNLPDHHDPDWWIKQRIASREIDVEGLLPVVVLLRREHERRAETLIELRDERSVREYAADYTRRVHEDRREHPFQSLIAPAWDEQDAVDQWRALRAARVAESAPHGPQPGPTDESAPPAPRRRWWPWRRRRL